ncbi:EamA family transporter RarD [Sulfitobacter mediterraneus]|uniref:EamA family transporter RarD n=1 Tax=Sulfitobacter mediterraneus TaxID=83219 RepID=UPI0021A29C7D|nr:EamA family transporter RarD [Sulfitobacter mediterraneus]UWR13397.1 EamA family transporter RarD [Sulfitobacter mediterraneus]
MSRDSSKTQNADSLSGLCLALSAYMLWGLLPIYLNMLAHISAIEVTAHRIIWSVPFAAMVLLVLGRGRDILKSITSKRMLGMGAVTAFFISMNWGIFAWAVAHERTVNVALGFFINPLISIMLGWVLLGEQLGRLQWVAVAIAVLTVTAGSLPWVAISLPICFALYALFKKILPVDPILGYFVEVFILMVPALACAAWFELEGNGAFINGDNLSVWLLLFSGAITAIPLMLFAGGAKRLRLSTIGILQYSSPSIIFLIAVLYLNEPISFGQMVAFPLIWLALILYSIPLIRSMRQKD